MRTRLLGEIWWVRSRVLMVSAKLTEESMGLKRTKAMCAAMRKTLLVAAMERMAGRKRLRLKRSQAMAGPMRKAVRASAAGRRRGAKEGPGRSKKCDMERV